jgi:hypothetical protein
MTTNLNASTSSGLIVTPDNSGTIELQSNGTTKATVSSSGFYAPGCIVQVVSATKTDTFSSSVTSMTDITGLSVSITPKSATSKILVSYQVCGGQDNTSVNQDVFIQLVRNSTPIGVGTTGGAQNASGTVANGITTNANLFVFRDALMFLDSPATTSATTYKLQGMSWNSGITWYINRRGFNGSFVFASSITAMEVAV